MNGHPGSVVVGAGADGTAASRDGDRLKSNMSSSVAACISRAVRWDRSESLLLRNRFSTSASSGV